MEDRLICAGVGTGVGNFACRSKVPLRLPSAVGFARSTSRFVKSSISTPAFGPSGTGGVGAPGKEPEKVNVVIFRENTEDVTPESSGRLDRQNGEIAAYLRKEFRSTSARNQPSAEANVGIWLQAAVEMAIRYGSQGQGIGDGSCTRATS